MRRAGLVLMMVTAVAASYLLGQHSSRPGPNLNARRILFYVDPMHPAWKSDKPGVAPDCGMKLEPVFASGDANPPPSTRMAQVREGKVAIDVPTQRMLGIRVSAAEKGSEVYRVHAAGRVIPQDSRIYTINSGADGFIRGTYEDSVGARVRKDQKLATCYESDILAPASGFLAALQGVTGAIGRDGAKSLPFPGSLARQGVSSLQGYTDRLRNLGMSDPQIKKMTETRQLPDGVDVVAPADGVVISRSTSPGQHFMHGMEFYRIADLSRVWIAAELFEQEASHLRPGSSAQVTVKDSPRRWTAHVTDSLPQSENGGDSLRVRLEVDNPDFVLRPETLVDVELPVHLPSAVTVPVDSVVDSGTNARVYVETEQGVFEPRTVETGWRYGERVEVRRGIQPGERVVASATFFVDSESRLKALPVIPANNHILSKVPTSGMPVDPVKAAARSIPKSRGGEYR